MERINWRTPEDYLNDISVQRVSLPLYVNDNDIVKFLCKEGLKKEFIHIHKTGNFTSSSVLYMLGRAVYYTELSVENEPADLLETRVYDYNGLPLVVRIWGSAGHVKRIRIEEKLGNPQTPVEKLAVWI